MLARLTAAIFGILLTLCGAATAQNYPSKSLTMIIPFAAGGPTDVLGRVVAQRMSEIMGQQVVVENVGGAGGMTGSKRVADAAYYAGRLRQKGARAKGAAGRDRHSHRAAPAR
jgi:tripartite-type tricarboxylate transporter receptor subunit TctC